MPYSRGTEGISAFTKSSAIPAKYPLMQRFLERFQTDNRRSLRMPICRLGVRRGVARNSRWVWTAAAEDALGNRWKDFEQDRRHTGYMVACL